VSPPRPLLLPPPRTDTSHSGLAEAVEADLNANRITDPELPVEPRLDPDATWGVAGTTEPFRNTVASVRFDAASADRRIGEILATYRERGAGCWWWAAPFHTPDDIPERLLAAGLNDEGLAPAMAVELAALPLDEPPPAELQIAPVIDERSLRAFLRVHQAEMAPGDDTSGPMDEAAVQRFADAVVPRLPLEPAPLRYVGRVDGEPVTTSRISLGGGVAGLYAVVTVPAFRGRGYGRAMTLAALRAARDLGHVISVLQATDAGYRVYERLGYRDVFAYRAFELPAGG
jgi:GNAT superfamily N-acetyltransferase